jgi:hypothetical protein
MHPPAYNQLLVTSSFTIINCVAKAFKPTGLVVLNQLQINQPWYLIV